MDCNNCPTGEMIKMHGQICFKCGVGEIDDSGRCGDCGYIYKLTNTGRKDDIGFKK